MTANNKKQNLIKRIKFGKGKKSSNQIKRVILEAKELLGNNFFISPQFYVPAYGSPYMLHLIGKERKEICASEQNGFYNTYTKEILENTDIKMKLFVDDYVDGEIQGLDATKPTNILSNTAYEIIVGKRKIIVYPKIIHRTNTKVNLQNQVWILPNRWFFSNKPELVKFRKLLKSVGFKKIIILPTDTFKEEGIPYLECCAIFCEKGYKGPLQVELNNGKKYQYDYSKKDVFLFGDDKKETNILYRCYELNEPYNWYRVSNIDLYKKQSRIRSSQYSVKPGNNTIKLVDLIQKNGVQIEEVNANEVKDTKGINTYRLGLTVMPGGTSYGQGLGAIQILTPGMMPTNKHFVAELEGVSTITEAKLHLDYMKSIGENLKNKTSSSPTIMGPQMKAVLRKEIYEREFGKI